MNKINHLDTFEVKKRKALILSAFIVFFIVIFWFSTIDIPAIDENATIIEKTEQKRGLFFETIDTIKVGFNEIKTGVSVLFNGTTEEK